MGDTLAGFPALKRWSNPGAYMPDIENSKVRVVTVVALICAIGGATWTIATKIDRLTTSIEDVKSNSYTLTAASEQAMRQAIENPGMRVPDPRDPNRIIVVTGSKTSGPSSFIDPTIGR